MLGITRLCAQTFRNYAAFDLEIEAPIIILTGANGAGKTNILESLSFLAPGRGLRQAKLAHVTHFDSSTALQDTPLASYQWSVAATTQTSIPGGIDTISLGTGFEILPTGTERRIIKIDGIQKKTQAEFSDWLSVVWATPEMDQLFLEDNSTQRKFIDRFVAAFDDQHTRRLYRYEHRIRERLTLLKSGHVQDAWLKTLETQLAEDSIAISSSRQETLQNLNTHQSKDAANPFPRFLACMQGAIEDSLQKNSALEAEERLAAHFKHARPKDAAAGRTHMGAHRSRLHVQHLGKNQNAEFCSTGEQKMLVLALILAFVRLRAESPLARLRDGFNPAGLLLLDDVVAHLDKAHRSALFQEIRLLNIQTWMAGTEATVFKELNDLAQVYNIEGNQIRLQDAL